MPKLRQSLVVAVITLARCLQLSLCRTKHHSAPKFVPGHYFTRMAVAQVATAHHQTKKTSKERTWKHPTKRFLLIRFQIYTKSYTSHVRLANHTQVSSHEDAGKKKRPSSLQAGREEDTKLFAVNHAVTTEHKTHGN